jgi:hypothetical protein
VRLALGLTVARNVILLHFNQEYNTVMYQVRYLCRYRPHWYDDVNPFPDGLSAVRMADSIAQNRQCVAAVTDSIGQVVYTVDNRPLFERLQGIPPIQ